MLVLATGLLLSCSELFGDLLIKSLFVNLDLGFLLFFS